MTMVITLSLLGLEGQTPSSLEDDGIGHGHLHNSSLFSFLGLEGQTSSFF